MPKTQQSCEYKCEECPVQCEGRSILIKLPPTVWESMEIACDVIGSSPGRIIQQIVSAFIGSIVAEAMEASVMLQHLKNKMN